MALMIMVEETIGLHVTIARVIGTTAADAMIGMTEGTIETETETETGSITMIVAGVGVLGAVVEVLSEILIGIGLERESHWIENGIGIGRFIAGNAGLYFSIFGT